MDLDQTQALIGLAGGLIGLLAVVGGWLRWVRPRIKSVRGETAAARDAILGRDAVIDSITGRELAPALPGIGSRMEHQEQQMQLLTEAVAKIADSHQRLGNLEQRVKQLEDGTIERIAAKAESVAAWRAVEKIADQGNLGDELPIDPELEG